MTNTQPERAYISLLIRPDHLSEEDIAQALNEVIPTDLYTIRMQCKTVPPNVIASLPIEQTKAAVELLRELGCIAFAPTLAELMALGQSLQIKTIRLESHGIQIETWRDGIYIIQPEDIDVIVSAKIKEQVQRPAFSGSPSSVFLSRSSHDGAIGAAGGSVSLSNFGDLPLEGFEDIDVPPLSTPKKTVAQFTCKLDLHTTRGDEHQVFHVNADKFGFEILGKEKGLADSVNTDRLREFFAALAPNAAVDPYFEFFKAPPDHHQLRIPRRNINNDHPAFAFYSRWAALMYRYLAV